MRKEVTSLLEAARGKARSHLDYSVSDYQANALFATKEVSFQKVGADPRITQSYECIQGCTPTIARLFEKIPKEVTQNFSGTRLYEPPTA